MNIGAEVRRSLFIYVGGFLVFNILILFVFFVLRVLLYTYNIERVESASFMEVVDSFVLGIRFDLNVSAIACLPLAFIGLTSSRSYRNFCLYWLGFSVAVVLLLGLMELQFYSEFQQRLNSLVLQYLKEDFSTVMTMVWYGLPVVTYTGAWLLATVLVWKVIRILGQRIYAKPAQTGLVNLPLVLLLLVVAIISSRGTLRSGSPLRWGDAYQSQNMFLNHLALNGTFTFFNALISENTNSIDARWLKASPDDEALTITRNLVVTESDRLVDIEKASVRRIHTPASTDSGKSSNSNPLNIVIILLESYSGRFTGALGNEFGVTPELDKLAEEGVLFTRFFSNGTHTHQGIFATLSCFPNLPGYEYLMQQPEGRHHFSGLTSLLPDYESLFIYNGDFSWDNQFGYLRNQGFNQFIGRDDFVNPVYVDPVWGVSDEDIFQRGVEEWGKLEQVSPFYLILQSLSNHMPYSLPEPLAFEPITDHGELSQRLTAMKYSDWALGEFFRKVKASDQYADTLFIILGDHGFVVKTQLTEVNLLRFHVPMLMIGPGLQKMQGKQIDIVASQVDIIPTIVGLLGKPVQHQCWGRDLFDLPEDDKGFAVIKPSGDQSTVALVKGNKVLTWDYQRGSHLYELDLSPQPKVKPVSDSKDEERMTRELRSFIQVAMKSLVENRTSN